MTDRGELEEAVSSHVERAAEKLRRQKLCASVLSVFVRTNPFKVEDTQYNTSHALRLPVATADTTRLLTAAKRAVHRIWRDGYRYKKAGVELLGLVPAASVQGDLWTLPDDDRRKSLMRALDRINDENGRATLHFAASGVERGWKLRCDQRSQRHTTDWSELLSVGL